MGEMQRSVFLSRFTYSDSREYKKEDFHNDFIYICSECYPSYDINYSMSTFGIPGAGTENAIVIDSMGGAIGRIEVSGVRLGDSTYGSNAYFAKEIRRMRSIFQLKENAYILRIYNAQMMKDGVVTHFDDSYLEFFVFLKRVGFGVSGGSPKTMEVNLSLVQRNKYVGFNKYVH